jgi:hypothetical protein
MASPHLVDIISALSTHQDLLRKVKLIDVVEFFDLACLIKPVIELGQSVHIPGLVQSLPVLVHEFLKACLGLDDDLLKLLWIALQDSVGKVAYNYELTDQLAARYLPYFLEHGTSRGIGVSTVFSIANLR